MYSCSKGQRAAGYGLVMQVHIKLAGDKIVQTQSRGSCLWHVGQLLREDVFQASQENHVLRSPVILNLETFIEGRLRGEKLHAWMQDWWFPGHAKTEDHDPEDRATV